jgi:hypothetical protein
MRRQRPLVTPVTAMMVPPSSGSVDDGSKKNSPPPPSPGSENPLATATRVSVGLVLRMSPGLATEPMLSNQ